MIDEKYKNVWQTFTLELDKVFMEMGELVSKEEIDLYQTLKNIYGIPYDEIRTALKYPKVQQTTENIGSVTGIFFEQAVASLAVPYIKLKHPTAIIGRNTCDSPSVRNIARDPDLYFRVNGKEVVIEMKVTPKKEALERIKIDKEKYDNLGIGYFLVGGYVSANKDLLNSFNSGGWACFLECSSSNENTLSNMPNFTTIMENVNNFLSG